MSLDFKELQELLGAIAQTDITEFTLKSENFELVVRKSAATAAAPTAIAPDRAIPPAPPPASLAPAPSTSEAPAEPALTPADKKWVSITSPMVGTFYRAPAPGEAPFVEVNDRVRQGQTVCIIEAMKLMNEIEAEISGQVKEIVVGNGEPVEYGQILIWVAPD